VKASGGDDFSCLGHVPSRGCCLALEENIFPSLSDAVREERQVMNAAEVSPEDRSMPLERDGHEDDPSLLVASNAPSTNDVSCGKERAYIPLRQACCPHGLVRFLSHSQQKSI